MVNNQNNPRRMVQIDEATLMSLLNQAGVSPGNFNQGQLVPRQNNQSDEYRIVDDSAQNALIPNDPEGLIEIDLNRDRNKVRDETFGVV